MKFITTKLENIPWLRHGFFTRIGGVSTGLYDALNAAWSSNDDIEHVRENRTRIAKALDLEVQNLVTLKQIHSATVITVKTPWTREATPEGDALVTNVEGIGLGVLTADCAPVLFADKKNKVIGAAHAGWKGAVSGVLEATVSAMQKLGSDPQDIVAALGPCIGANSYEVSEDFKIPFMEQTPDNGQFFKPAEKAGHLMFDLPSYVAHRLRVAGVGTFLDTRQDTLANEAVYFSYRRACLSQEKDYGRQMSVITLA